MDILGANSTLSSSGGGGGGGNNMSSSRGCLALSEDEQLFHQRRPFLEQGSHPNLHGGQPQTSSPNTLPAPPMPQGVVQQQQQSSGGLFPSASASTIGQVIE